MARRKVAFVTTYDARDVNNWSGIPYFMAKAIQKHVGDVTYIQSGSDTSISQSVKKTWYKYLRNRSYHPSRAISTVKRHAKQVQEAIAGDKYDLVFSPGTHAIAFLETKTPIVFWTDAVFHAMIDYYFFNLAEETITQGNIIEQEALRRTLLAIYSSQWAASGAANFYHVDSSKVKVVPFGANIEVPPVNAVHKQKTKDFIQLLFVGKDWERKGGNIAYETLNCLLDRGRSSKLTIVGCAPRQVEGDANVIVYPHLNKRDSKDVLIIDELYRNSDFLILPSRRECYGIVFCEANSYGIPVLSTKTGGISDIIENGVNGFLVPLDSGANEYAEKILETIDGNLYEQLSLNSRARFERRLNWDSAAEEVNSLLKEIL